MKRAGERAFHLHRFNIGPRLTLCFLFINLTMLAGSAALLWQFHLVLAQAGRLRGVDQELIAVLQAHTNLMKFCERLNDVAYSQDAARLLREAEPLRNFLLEDNRSSRRALNRLPPETQPDPALLPTLESIQGSLRAQFEAIVVLAAAGEWHAIHLRLDNEVRPLESSISELAGNTDREVSEERAQTVSNIGQAQRRIVLTVVFTAALMLLFAVFLGLAVTRSITLPLGCLMEASKALGRSDFQHRVSIIGDNELAHLGRVFNDTAGILRDLYETLRRREAYLAEAQRLSHTGSFGVHVSSGKIDWSAETFRIFELAPAIQPTFERVLERVHPEDRQLVQQVMDAAIRQRQTFDFEHRLLMADGSVKHVRAVGYPSTRGEAGDTEFVGAVTDITGRKRAEEELQQLVDLVPQVIVVLGPDGDWIHANRVAREYTGLTLDEYRSVDVIGKVIHSGDVERMRAARTRALSGRTPFELEARLRGRDGEYRWFLFRYNPLVEQGRVRRWYASATEIESLKQEEERVRRENVRLEERTRIAQELHDTLLQTFLGASMQLSVARDDVPADASIKPRLDRILQLIYQGIEEGRKTIQDLRSSDSRTLDLVLALSGVQQELAVQPDIDFRVSVTGRQQPLPALIRQEIYRIGKEALVNAFCHSQAKRVEFELEYADSGLRLRVRDNGCGIDPQVLHTGRAGHWGLTGMRERATRIGGRLEISSSSSAGTEVQLSVPSGIAFQASPGDPSL